jgi:hypothetical protein
MIKYALALHGYKQVDVAVVCGVAANTVCAVIQGRSRSLQIERKIRDLTGVALEELWPQWHGPNAKRRRPRRSLTSHQIADALQAADALRARAG